MAMLRWANQCLSDATAKTAEEQSPEILGAKIGADLVGKSQRLAACGMDPQLGEIASGYLTVCHGK